MREEIDIMREDSPASCQTALKIIGRLPTVHPCRKPLRAPGYLAPPAPDARQSAELFEGWSRLTVPGIYEDVEGDGYYHVNRRLADPAAKPVDIQTDPKAAQEKNKRQPLPTGPVEPIVTRDLSLPDIWPSIRSHHHAWYAIKPIFDPDPDETLWLLFDAVGHECTVYLNGEKAGGHLGAYTPFGIELTPFLHEGENTLAVRVQDDTSVKNLREQRVTAMLDFGKPAINAHMAGICGGVYLEHRTATHAAKVRIRTSTRQMKLQVETWMSDQSPERAVRHAVHEWPHGSRPVLELPEEVMPAKDGLNDKGGPDVLEQEAAWPDPKLWSPQHPNLYVLRTTVIANGRSETIETRFGFREFWIEGREFKLNGQPVRLLGDAGMRPELMSIVPCCAREYARQALEFLKKHFNYMSARLHKLVHPVWTIEAADEAGVLLIQQSGMHSGKRKHYQNGGETLMKNLEREFAEWYWRDVNSPSVVIWDLENEIIRGQRDPELFSWCMRLDSFIKKLDPRAITAHSGAGWYHPQQQIVHVHMQEQYSRILRDWRAQSPIPLLMGEFWMGGNGETRLPNSYEYADREDWHREEARLYREHMLEMRYYGASGILPHRLVHWPLVASGPILSRERMDKLGESPYRWRFETVRAQGARGMAPVVGFVWPRSATVVEGETFTREVVVCNDSEDTRVLHVSCTYSTQSEHWELTLRPAEQQRRPVKFTATAPSAGGPNAAKTELTVGVRTADGDLLESDRVELNTVPREAIQPPSTRRRLIVVPEPDRETAETLKELGVDFKTSSELPEDGTNTIVLVPEGAPDDALGRNPVAVRRYLESGGQILALAQDKPPRWMPVDLPFWSPVRPSEPAYTGAGWEPTNKDLNFTREAPVYAAGHPAFASLKGCDFKEWHPVDGRLSDDAFIRPNTVGVQAGGAYRALLGATRREVASLMEHRCGKGTAVFCQAQVLNARAHPAARAVFFNLLNYLDGSGWTGAEVRIGLLGELTPEHLSALTGIGGERFQKVEGIDEAPDLILAGNHADTELIHALTESGRRVLVLSVETCGRLPGYRTESDPEGYYSATRAGISDHPLFWGVAGASFQPLEQTPAKGALADIPADARILLGGHARGHSPFGNDWTVDIGFFGLETRDPAPPLAAVQTFGDGECIATTLEPWNERSETHRQLLVNLLANAGVDVPAVSDQTHQVEVRHTVPLKFDGRLDDWTNDTDDINISRYSHAQPIALDSRDRTAGSVEDDLDLSGIVYFLHDAHNLYIGGIIFSQEAPPALEVVIDGTVVGVDPEERALTIDGKPFTPPALATGHQPAFEVIDTRLLRMMRFQKERAEPCFDTPGRTFELALPWGALGKSAVPDELQAQVRIKRADGAELGLPHPNRGDQTALNLVTRRSTLPV